MIKKEGITDYFLRIKKTDVKKLEERKIATKEPFIPKKK